MKLPKTKKEADELNSIFFFNGKPCKRGHIAKRYTKGYTCYECRKIVRRQYENDFPEKLKEYLSRPEVVKRKRNLSKQRYKDNKTYILKRIKQWDLNNRGKRNMISSNRRALKLNATPAWADFNKIQQIYEEAQEKTQKEGIQYHVDHIIPLSNKFVCGLHCEDNLQIITAHDNFSKSNIFDID